MTDASVLALADDLTGALEIGAKFADAGIGSVVTMGAQPGADAPVLVIDTETRHLSPEQAYRTVRAIAEQARCARLVYKKTDSTLRGNIASELAALVDVFVGPVLYAPAYPEHGRTVKGGCLYVDGIPVSETAFARDALNPIRDSSIPRLLGRLALDGAVRVVDGACDDDLRAAADALLARDGLRLAAGPAAFAGRLADRIELARAPRAELPALRTGLVVNGSRHEQSLDQVRFAEESGWAAAPPDRIVQIVRSAGWAILRADDILVRAGIAPARAVGCFVRDILDRVELDALVVFGGDTAAGIVLALDITRLYPVREVLPGVPLSRLEPAGRPWLVTKAGGFGAVDVLPKLRLLLSRER